MGKVINKRSDGKWLTLNNKITKRNPVDHLSDLSDELTDIKKLLKEIKYQGYEFGDKELYAVLNKTISTLLKDPQLHLVLGMPVKSLKATYGLNGKELLNLLTEILYDINHDDEYKYLLQKKPTAPRPVGAVHPNTTRPPPNHIKGTVEGLPCINERDNGKCELEGCKGIHNNENLWSGKECNNPCYVKYKLCPGFIRRTKESFKECCKDKHSSKLSMTSKAELDKLKEQAKKDFPALFVTSCEE